MQIKTTVRYHFTPVRLAAILKNPTKSQNKQKVLVRMLKNWNPLALLVGM